MIDAAAILKIVVTLSGCWAAGYSVGKVVAWTRAIRGVA